MADDNDSRYPTDPSSRGQHEPANDPLVELARLIGRSDPFADLARDARPQAPRDNGSAQSSEPPQFGADQPRYRPEPPRYSSEPQPRYADPAPRFGSERASRYDAGEWPGTPAPQPQQSHHSDPFALPSQPQAPTAPAEGEQHYAAPSFPELRMRPGMDNFQSDRHQHSFEAAAFPPESEPPPFPQALYPEEPESGQMPPPHDDEFYDDAPRGGRRKGLMTVAAVLALAVVGTAAAFGYRSMFGGTHTSAPPVIRASGEPSKVAPPPVEADPSSNKINYDRFGDRDKDEQVVVREEKPVDSKELARSSAPRTVFPVPPTSVQSPAATTATPAAPSALGEPRRVRTVQIRPDQPLVPVPPQAIGGATSLPLAPPPRPGAETEAPAESTAPLAPAARTSSHPVTRNTRVAARSTPAEPVANAPLSLSPNRNDNVPPPPAVRETPRASAPPPARLASAPAAAGSGGYLVQVSSQRSEADAQSSFRSIQSKYSGVLGGQPHLVRRADLGAKGVYYRAMVGPFGSRDQAIQVCSSLKAAGGDCVVQSN